MSTKEKLYDTALHLFSEKGYTASSIRDICYANNVKESTVYYYYKNKEAMLDSMRERFCNNAKEAKAKLDLKISNPTLINRDTFFAVADIFVDKLLTDEFQNRFIRVLRLEQGCNEQLRALYHEWLYEMPMAFAERFIEQLMSLGYLKDDSAAYLAIIYYSPIYFCYERSFAFGERTDKTCERFKRLVYSHLQSFLEQYSTDRYI
ncbi:MAG: TetR/AcrR family transcriptional regulator [Oscillospiraceae bacterium]